MSELTFPITIGYDLRMVENTKKIQIGKQLHFELAACSGYVYRDFVDNNGTGIVTFIEIFMIKTADYYFKRDYDYKCVYVYVYTITLTFTIVIVITATLTVILILIGIIDTYNIYNETTHSLCIIW